VCRFSVESFTWLSSLKEGDEFVNPDFWSTSKSFDVANRISSAETQKVIFIIEINEGADLANYAGLEGHDTEDGQMIDLPSHEVVLMPGKKFRVIEATGSSRSDINRIIRLKEL